MKVGVPKELKNNENRVGMTPSGVQTLVAHGHEVYVQHTAGEGSGFKEITPLWGQPYYLQSKMCMPPPI